MAIRVNKNGPEPGPEELSPEEIQRLFSRPPLRPGMDFCYIERSLYLTIPSQIHRLGPPIYDQWVIRSDGSVFYLDEVRQTLCKDGVKDKETLIRRAIPLQLNGRYIEPRVELEDVKIAVLESNFEGLYERVLAKIKKYLKLEFEYQYHLFAAFLMGTHLYKVFNKFPFLVLLSRQAGSGKTTALKLASFLAYNAEKFSGITDAALIDTASTSACTVELDEFEIIGRAIVEQGRTKEIVNSLFERGGRVRRKEKDPTGKRWILADHFIYNPTIIAKLANGGVPPTIRDRAIILKLKRLDGVECSIQQNGDVEDDPEWQELYCLLAAWGLANAENVYNASQELTRQPFGINRRKDVWKPLLSITSVVSPMAFEILADVAQRPEPSFVEEIPRELECVFDKLDDIRIQGCEKVKVIDLIEALGTDLAIDLRNTKRLCAALEPYQESYGLRFDTPGTGAYKHIILTKR